MMVRQTHYAQLLHQPILGCSIFVATPGRLNDFLKGESVCFKKLQYLILDEVDQMSDMGFGPKIKEIRNVVGNRECHFNVQCNCY